MQSLDASHLVTFLIGAFTGAAAHYLGDKYTDQRRRQEARAAAAKQFDRIERAMPDLIAEMRKDLAGNALVRDFAVVPKNAIDYRSGYPVFRYYEDEHENLQNKIVILEEAGYVRPIPIGNMPRFRMSEEFVNLVIRG